MEEWQRSLIINPPRAFKNYSKEEWEYIVLNELFNPKNCNIGKANPYYGQHHTKEIKKQISQAIKNRMASLSSEQRKLIHGLPGNLNGMFGTNRSGSLNPMFGKHHSPESIEKIKIANTGKCPSNQTLKKLSKAHKAFWDSNPELKEARSIEYKSRGIKPPSPKGMLWWNNGIDVVRAKQSPGPNWKRGRKI